MKFNLEEAKSLRDQGFTLKEVAKQVGFSEGYVRQKLSGYKRAKLTESNDVVDEIQKIRVKLGDIVELLTRE